MRRGYPAGGTVNVDRPMLVKFPRHTPPVPNQREQAMTLGEILALAQVTEARIAEDEDLAMRSVQIGEKGAALYSFGTRDAPPVLIFSPARVLAECEVMRSVVNLLTVDAQDPHNALRREWATEILRAYAQVPR